MLNYWKLLPKNINKIVDTQDFCIDKIPFTLTLDAGVLFTDVKAFTKMTEQVSKSGHYSVEIITDLLNSYFDEMYKSIDKYNGDLFKFGGDSILAIFPGSKSEAQERISACLYEMETSLEQLNIKFKEQHNLTIDFHGNATWGEVKINIVGNVKHHLDYFISGPALESLFKEGDKPLKTSSSSLLTKQESFPINESNGCNEKFIPQKVANWLRNGKFTGELKKSAVIFIHLKNADENQVEIDLAEYNKFFTKLQDIIYFYDGTLNKIDFTDKGYLILITFGVPFIHKDDIERAFASCLKISKIKVAGIKTRIGLTYNYIYSGILGAKNRYEYGIIGNGVNIAARLMAESKESDFAFSSEILPYIKGRYQVNFVKNVQVKGISDKIDIYHVSNEYSDFWSAYEENFQDAQLIGYEQELSMMEKHHFTIIQGPSGSGKSHLLYTYLKDKILNQKINILILSEYDKLKSFNLFNKVFALVKNIDDIFDDLPIIKDYLKEIESNIDLSPVKEFFTEKDLEIKLKSLPMVLDILSDILVLVLAEHKYFVVENMSCLDYKSSSLMKALIPKLLTNNKNVCLTSSDSETSEEYNIYLPLVVSSLEFDEKIIRQYILCKNLNITSAALREILKLANKNPAYIKEICSIIKDFTNNSDTTFDVSDFKQLVRAGKLPNKFETLLLNEFESLDDETKQLLKYASIMGISFSNQISEIFSEDFIQIQIEKVLEKLTNNRHIFKKVILPEIEYFFNNSLMRDAIYNTILFKEKKKIHLTIAKYFINEYKDSLDSFYEVIANHYISAKSPTQAIKWSLLAASKNFKLASFAISSFYYKEALSFSKDDKQRNKILLQIINSDLERNKIMEVKEHISLINLDFLEQKDRDLLHLAHIRLLDIQKDYDKLIKLAKKLKDKIQSFDVKMRIDLIMLDYYRMTNKVELFNELQDNITSIFDKLSITLKIIFYSISGQHTLDKADYKQAHQIYSNLLKIAQENNKRIFLRISYTSLGIIEIRKGNQDNALEYFNKALAIAENIGDKHGYAKVNTEIAMILFAQGKDDEAISSLEKCLYMAKYIGDKQQEQTVLYNFGYIYSILQDFDKAIAYFQQAKEIAEIISDKVGITYANDGMGDAYFNKQDFNTAKDIYQANLDLQKKLGDKEGVAHTIGNLANILREEKKYDKALEYYKTQYESLTEIGDKIGQGKALFNWAITHEILGDDTLALQKLKSAYDLFDSAGDINYADFTEQQINRIKAKSND